MNVKSAYLVRSGKKIRLARLSTQETGAFHSRAEAHTEFIRHRLKLNVLQELLTAENKHAILVVLQGMDTAGKDGTIRHIFTGVNPQACTVTSFKVPTPLERQHDFLWRVHNAVPRTGTIGIFNRSHYEDVLVTRVHNTIPAKVAQKRLAQIADFESILAANGVTILKFFLHISREEQTRRLESRLADVTKHWKVSEGDFAERHFWPKYEEAYEEAINATSRKHAPWFIIPSDQKWYRNFAISRILVETLESLKMKYPTPTFDPAKIHL